MSEKGFVKLQAKAVVAWEIGEKKNQMANKQTSRKRQRDAST